MLNSFMTGSQKALSSFFIRLIKSSESKVRLLPFIVIGPRPSVVTCEVTVKLLASSLPITFSTAVFGIVPVITPDTALIFS